MFNFRRSCTIFTVHVIDCLALAIYLISFRALPFRCGVCIWQKMILYWGVRVYACSSNSKLNLSYCPWMKGIYNIYNTFRDEVLAWGQHLTLFTVMIAAFLREPMDPKTTSNVLRSWGLEPVNLVICMYGWSGRKARTNAQPWQYPRGSAVKVIWKT